jgi:hypothetical protein
VLHTKTIPVFLNKKDKFEHNNLVAK